MKKRILSMLLILCLVIGIISTAAFAASGVTVEIYRNGYSSGTFSGTNRYYHNDTHQINSDPTGANAVMDFVENTLTLNNLDLIGQIKISGGGITVVLTGTNKISYTPSSLSQNWLIFCDDGDLAIKGPGSLELNSSNGVSSAVHADGKITISNGAKIDGTIAGSGQVISGNNVIITGEGTSVKATATGNGCGINVDNKNNGGTTLTVDDGATLEAVSANDKALMGVTALPAAGSTVTVGESAPGSAWDSTTDINTYKYVKIVGSQGAAHVHSWTYTASGATITASCGGAGCDFSGNTSITIKKPAYTTYGSSGSKEATIADSKTSVGGVNSLEIKYYITTDGITYTEINGAPVNPGSYKASVTAGTATAEVKYEIAKKDKAYSSFYAQDFEISEITSNSFVVTIKESDHLGKTLEYVAYLSSNVSGNVHDLPHTTATVTDGKFTVTVPSELEEESIKFHIREKAPDEYTEVHKTGVFYNIDLPAAGGGNQGGGTTPTTYDDYEVSSTTLSTVAAEFNGVADVTEDNGVITIKLTSSINGRIWFRDNSGEFVLDLNGNTIDAGTRPEAVCLDNDFNGKVTVTGSGTMKTGGNNIIYNGAELYFDVADGYDYFTLKEVTASGSADVFEEKNTSVKELNFIYTEGLSLVMTQGIGPVAPTPTEYEIAVSASPAAGGIVRGSGTYEEGDSVTVTAAANSGYHFVKWTEGGSQVSTSASYTFTAAADRTLVAVFEKDAETFPVTGTTHSCQSSCSICGACTDYGCTDKACATKCTAFNISYTDVKAGQWYTEPVNYVSHRGMMEGVGNDLFDINGTTTRAMIVTILWRLEGKPVVNSASVFNDVENGQWYSDAVAWANMEGIVEGYDGKFDPMGEITREQFATILWRYAKYKGYDVSVGEDTDILGYKDALSTSEYAVPAMQWACGSSLMEGDGASLTPRAEATRAQAAALFQRFCENVAEK